MEFSTFMVPFSHQKYFIKEVSYYYSCFVGGEITTEVVKITHPNKDQVGIMSVFPVGLLYYPLNPDSVFISMKFWRVLKKGLMFKIFLLFGESELNIKIPWTQCELADSWSICHVWLNSFSLSHAFGMQIGEKGSQVWLRLGSLPLPHFVQII